MLMTQKPPYFGVAGVTTSAQAAGVAAAGMSVGRIVAYGVLASFKTITGLPAGNPKRYPRREELADIFGSYTGTLGILHYNGPNGPTLASQLAGAMRWAGPHCDGIQLNIAWPDLESIRGFRISYPGKLIVFQLNSKAMAQCDNNPALVVERIALQYANNIDYVLLDPSGGRGIPLTLEMAVPYLEAFQRFYGDWVLPIRLGVAGGFGPNDVSIARQLLDAYPMLSIDAEGKLRNEDDELDSEKVRMYLRRLATPRE